MKKNIARVFSALIAVLLVCTLLPATVLATGVDEGAAVAQSDAEASTQIDEVLAAQTPAPEAQVMSTPEEQEAPVAEATPEPDATGDKNLAANAKLILGDIVISGNWKDPIDSNQKIPVKIEGDTFSAAANGTVLATGESNAPVAVTMTLEATAGTAEGFLLLSGTVEQASLNAKVAVKIPGAAFTGGAAIESGDDSQAYWDIAKHFVWDRAGKKLDIYTDKGVTLWQNTIQKSDITAIAFKSGVKNIPDSVFEGCNNLMTVAFVETLESIGAKAFKDCTKLGAVSNWPPNLKSLGASAFENCSEMFSRVALSPVLSVVPDNAFKGCAKIPKVFLMEGLTEIGASAFEGCVALNDLSLPGSLQKIGENAFYGCTGNTSFILLSAKKPPAVATNSFVNVPGKIRVLLDSYEAYLQDANWSSIRDQIVKVVTISYDANGGSGDMPYLRYYIDETASARTANNAFVAPKGKTFNSWNTKEDGTGTKYAANVSLQYVTDNLILYAQWSGGPTPTPGPNPTPTPGPNPTPSPGPNPTPSPGPNPTSAPGAMYTINATAGTGGSISASGNVSVAAGSDFSFYITPSAGYRVAKLTVDGKAASADANNVYTFRNVQGNHTIHVTFTQGKTAPKTGDESNLLPMLIVVIAAGGAAAALIAWKRRTSSR